MTRLPGGRLICLRWARHATNWITMYFTLYCQSKGLSRMFFDKARWCCSSLYKVKWLESLFMQSVFYLISEMYVVLCYFSVLLWGRVFHPQCNSCPIDARAVWRSYALSSMWHHCAKEGRMRLAPVYGLSHWDLLGYQRTSLGSKGKKSFFNF